jgi:hypothetical protein
MEHPIAAQLIGSLELVAFLEPINPDSKANVTVRPVIEELTLKLATPPVGLCESSFAKHQTVLNRSELGSW